MELGELARLFAVSPATIRRRLKAQGRSLYLLPGDQRLRMVREEDIRAIFQDRSGTATGAEGRSEQGLKAGHPIPAYARVRDISSIATRRSMPGTPHPGGTDPRLRDATRHKSRNRVRYVVPVRSASFSGRDPSKIEIQHR